MSICSVVVFTRPEKTLAVSGDISGREGCEVVAAEEGKVVVVLDMKDRQKMSDTIMALNNIDGVITVSLVYEYFESDDVIGEARVAEVTEGDGCCAVDESCGCEG